MSPAKRSDEVWSIDDLELELRKLPGVRAAGFEESDDILIVQLHVADRVERISRSDRNDQSVPVSASRIAARHSDRPVAVEIVRWRTSASVEASAPPAPLPTEAKIVPEPAPQPTASVEPGTPAATVIDATTDDEASASSRTRLLAVLAFPDTDELEVHLVLDGRRTIGRAPASRGIDGAVEATIDAVRDLGAGIHPRLRWARAIDDAEVGNGDQEVVAVALDGVDSRTLLHYGMAAGTSLIDAAARATLDALNRRLSRTS
jgi:hypothetical protein